MPLEDPWRDATVSSSLIDYQSTSSTPVLLGTGNHCEDFWLPDDVTFTYIQDQTVRYMRKWLADWIETRPLIQHSTIFHVPSKGTYL